MPLDCYKVEVIHYLNPHQIWIEVRDSTVLNEDFLFEQIGVYGVLPQEKTTDVHTESLTSLSCEEWLQAAVVVMKDLLAESDEVWFSPIHIDRRTSIFDDNIHKYGELICKTKNGKYKKLSKYLIKFGFAYLNVCEFHEKLSCGKLNTELNTTQTQQVTMELEKYCLRRDTPKSNRKKSTEEQTSELNMTQNFESSLTVSNLEKHNKDIIKKTLKDEYKDFAQCEDVDDKSLGRAYCKTKVTPKQDKKTLLLSKLTLCKQIANSPKHHDSKLFKYPKNFEKARLVDDYFENANPVDDFKMEQNEMKKLNTFKKSIIDETDSCGQQFEGKAKPRNHLEKKLRSQHQLEEKRSSHQTGVKTDCDFQEKKVDMHKSARTAKPMRHKSAVTAQIAFGPPEMDRKYFKIQTVTDIDEEEEYEKKKIIEIEKVATSEKRDCMYGNVDSEVGVEITNKKTLKDYLNKGNNGENANDSEETVKNYEKSVKSSEINDCSITSNVKCKNKEVMLENCAKIKKRDNLVGISNIKNEPKEEYVKNRIEMNYRVKKKIQNENKLVKCGEEINDTNKSIDKKISSVIKRKLKTHDTAVNYNSSFSSSDTSNKVSSSDVASNNKAEDDENIIKEIENLYFKDKDDNINKLEDRSASELVNTIKLKNNVNPFKNIDPNMSVFVDKLVTPVLMVHSNHDKRIQPAFEMRDVYFNSHIKNILRNMAIEGPMTLQSLSWPVILRGYSLFMISPMASGKTLGYLPAVCRSVSDSKLLNSERGGPVCIIVCATAQSVTNVEKLAKMFLESDKKVLACYAGVDHFHITSTLLNGCDLLIATPSSLVKLLHATDFGVHLRHLSTFVLDDCERLSLVYADEINFFIYKIREMLKIRATKELNVQYVLASRIWCDFMEPLAKKVPDTVICIGAFQECVLYSKSNTSVALVKKVNKVDSVMEFLKDINASKRTVIVCQSKEEVALLERALKRSKHIIFSCNDDMTVHDLYNLTVSWADYKEPLIGPILICCDGNLIHMNITDAHNLIHYSMPPLFSMFCKRFSVLNDNYPSIFKTNNENVKIKVLLEESNVEQLPKILNFIKRCTDNVPSVLDEIASNVLKERDVIKARKYYPLCDSLLTLGYCPDVYNCQERHTILKDYDAPKDWLPKEGTITCKVLYYHSATLYSARVLSCTINGTTTNYPQTYNQLSLKMGMYYSKESNRKLHGIPEIGDICATSIKLNFYVRCQVLKILDRYERGNPNKILVKLIDEEKLEVTRDIYLYHLPDELKKIEARVVQVRLANIEPKDKDITFSELARDRLKEITETDTELFVRGDVCLTLGNCIFVSTLEACLDLTSLNETVVKHNLKQELLENHAIPNPEHLFKLQKLCTENGLILKKEKNMSEPKTPIKNLPKGTWAHLERDSLSRVFFASAINPDKFFVRLDKFDPVMAGLLQDIEKYVDSNPIRCANVKEGEIVLAKFPADDTYERARIDGIKEETAKCFFVDQGDWSEIPLSDLIPITEKFINQLPFQAIECRLVGIQPLGVQWTDFSTYWFIDSCHNDKGDLKYLFVKYFTKEPAEFTNGHKYGVAVIDTSTDQDVILNQLMIDLNLAQVNHNEIKYLDDLDLKTPERKQQSDTEDDVWVETQTAKDATKETENDSTDEKYIVPVQSNILFKAPIRSVPLVNSDNESDDPDKWDVNVDDDCMNLFPALQNLKDLEDNMPKVHTGNAVTSAEQNNNLFPELTNVKDLEDNMLEVHTINIVKSAERDNKRAAIVELDSDDLTSPDNSFVSPDKPIVTNEETDKDTTPILDMRAKGDGNKKSVLDLSAETDEKKKVLDLRSEINLKRRPKLVWCQNTTSVTIKIQLIGVDNYNLDIKGRILSFSADVNDTEYGFEIELYGVVQETCSHVNKGQYILVKLKKVLTKNWLTLTKDCGIKKWIVYDVDGLDIPDEESTEDNNEDIFCNIRNRFESESEDDDFDDDISRGYKKYD